MEKQLKIMNLEGSDILKNNLDKRRISKKYNGVFAQSLLLNRLIKEGLHVNANSTTRDIITVQFTYGYTPFEECNKLNTKIEELKTNITNLVEIIYEQKNIKSQLSGNKEKKPVIELIKDLERQKRESKNEIKSLLEEIKDLKLSAPNIREMLYQDGFKLDYYRQNRTTKEYYINETIDYVFWFRTPSKSRVGDCVFINKKLIGIKEWQTMGLNANQNELGKVIEMEAYKSLTASGIKGKVNINPDNILVVNDLKSTFETKCAVVKTNKNDECYVEYGLREVENILFDGQALLDRSLFEGNNSMMLLRNHFFKACAFKTNIEQFMKDWCECNKKDYNTHRVTGRYGNKIFVKDILMITTENAMKWEKFGDLGADFEYWKMKVNEDDNIFGICKEDHPSKYGNLQRMSYQQINSLDISQKEMDKLVGDTIKFVETLKNDTNNYFRFLKQNSNITNGNDMLLDLVEINPDFTDSYYFRKYKTKDISEFLGYVKSGKVLVNGDNLTVIGNPYTMLLHSVGDVPIDEHRKVDEKWKDETLEIDASYISVYTKRFNDNVFLAGFRNPHNSPNNIIYAKNSRHKLIDKYFCFNDNIIAVNMIRTEVQDLANSMDQDSDFCLFTDNSITVKSASRIFRTYPCIVNGIGKRNNDYVYNMRSVALIDNLLAEGKYNIGLTSNLAQLALSWYWDNKDEKLADIVCIMSVLAQCAIDNSKRMYDVDISSEISRLSAMECMDRTVKNSKGNKIKAKPSFFRMTHYKVNEESLEDVNCPMCYLSKSLEHVNSAEKKARIDNDSFIKSIEGKANSEQMKRIIKIVGDYDSQVKKYNDECNSISSFDKKTWNLKLSLMQSEVIEEMSAIKLDQKTMQMLVKNALCNNKHKSKKYVDKLLNALYRTHKKMFLSIWIFKGEKCEKMTA